MIHTFRRSLGRRGELDLPREVASDCPKRQVRLACDLRPRDVRPRVARLPLPSLRRLGVSDGSRRGADGGGADVRAPFDRERPAPLRRLRAPRRNPLVRGDGAAKD